MSVRRSLDQMLLENCWQFITTVVSNVEDGSQMEEVLGIVVQTNVQMAFLGVEDVAVQMECFVSYVF